MSWLDVHKTLDYILSVVKATNLNWDADEYLSKLLELVHLYYILTKIKKK